MPSHKNDRNRSLTLAHFGPLASSRINYFSMQRGPAAAQAENPPAKMRVFDPTEVLYDFSDTAAMIANLDLVITVDTAVAHLAGALGKRVWTLLPFNPDWRWMLERSDSPWYPTMRLFRQKKAGDWADVITRVARGDARVGRSGSEAEKIGIGAARIRGGTVWRRVGRNNESCRVGTELENFCGRRFHDKFLSSLLTVAHSSLGRPKHGSLSPVHRGEGWGEGPSVSRRRLSVSNIWPHPYPRLHDALR